MSALLAVSGLFSGVSLGVLEIGLNLALQLDRHRLAVAVQASPRGDPDPPFADAIFFDVGLFLPLEADSDAALKKLRVEMRTARIERETVGWSVGQFWCSCRNGLLA